MMVALICLPQGLKAQDYKPRYSSTVVSKPAISVPAQKYNALSCPPPNDPPKIMVRIESQPPLIDHNRSQYKLEDFETSGVSPYGADSYTKVQGLMRGTIKVESSITMGWRANKAGDENCYWYQGVDLVLRQAPIIYVAKEVPKGTCEYAEIIKHEKKHVAVDQQLLDEYLIIYRGALQKIVAEVGVKGPYPNLVHEESQSMMRQAVSQVVKDIHTRMRQERLYRQNNVDTLEEYERVNAACIR